MRQTWLRTMQPAGLTIDAIYDIFRKGSGLDHAACNDYGTSGFIQLLDITLSDDGDVSNDRLRSGYAQWVDLYENVRSSGLCMIEANYVNPVAALPADQMSPTNGYPQGLPPPMPMPWNVKPVVLARVEADFSVTDHRQELIANAAADPAADGYFYFDEATGRAHSYVVQSWMVVYTISRDNFLTIPIREVETTYEMNHAEERSCIGSFRGGDLDPAAGCDSADPSNPQWGCPGDVECSAGEGPGHSQGYFLITEIEQVQSQTLGQTLCVLLPGQSAAEMDGFSATDPTIGGLGLNCRMAPGWDPANGGLPHGDWCAATNSPATADCHDAFRSDTRQTFQGFNVADETCEF